ncbi:sugar phosphate isomerase/epimerase family protein [Paenibacillus ihuae]|uniref:sugar phosphate isomerase/epimerase family protein n=1 Tax=Paenibacillus ihuae TaxID=1232431 RepID=UPI0006D5B13B|nr:TIM barrel protein [Paenibacillus ihuae]
MSEIPAGRRGIFAKELFAPAIPVRAGIQEAADRGFDGLYLGSPASISPELDRKELEEAGQFAKQAGIVLGISAGMLNPYQPGRSVEALEAGGGDLALGLLRLIEAARWLGQHEVMLVVGTEYDRFNRTLEWSEQLRAVASLLRRIQPDVRSIGSRILIKTHQEITSWEVARLLDGLEPEVFAAAFDPVNLIVRMENPLAAAGRLAGRISQVHVDDAQLLWSGSGLARALCPAGTGCIPWPDLTGQIRRSDPGAWYWGELHQAELVMPFLSPGWFDEHADIGLEETASWLSKAQPLVQARPSLIGVKDERVAGLLAYLAAS